MCGGCLVEVRGRRWSLVCALRGSLGTAHFLLGQLTRSFLLTCSSSICWSRAVCVSLSLCVSACLPPSLLTQTQSWMCGSWGRYIPAAPTPWRGFAVRLPQCPEAPSVPKMRGSCTPRIVWGAPSTHRGRYPTALLIGRSRSFLDEFLILHC